MIIWITGQPGAGKTTLARWIKNNHIPAVIVDGDELREALNNFDYSEAGNTPFIAPDIPLHRAAVLPA